MKILALESSCDETAAALLTVSKKGMTLEKNIVSSQIAIHAKYGGVVPEVAARNHVLTIIPVLESALEGKKPDVIAVTAGPGLVTSLLIGVETARTLSYAWNRPLIPINHIEGHVAANWLEEGAIEFPAVVLIVSGGHTELVLMKGHDAYELIGETRDDAAGEAFDKVAKILGLGYPGGPAVSYTALKGDPSAISFPRPMIDSKDLHFSFSGLKTAVLYAVEPQLKKKGSHEGFIADVCASFQQAAIDVLVSKTIRAARIHGAKSVLLAGGVAANTLLRTTLRATVEGELPGVYFSHPQPKNCTDNAAMIAAAAALKFSDTAHVPWERVAVQPNWRIHEPYGTKKNNSTEKGR